MGKDLYALFFIIMLGISCYAYKVAIEQESIVSQTMLYIIMVLATIAGIIMLLLVILPTSKARAKS